MQTPRNGRFAAMYSLTGSDKATLAELEHRVRGGADTGQDHSAGVKNVVRVRADDRIGANVRERTGNASQVARVVVHDNTGPVFIVELSIAGCWLSIRR